MLKSREFTRVWGWACRRGLQPTERRKAIEFKSEDESGCVLLKFPGEEEEERGKSVGVVRRVPDETKKNECSGGEDRGISAPRRAHSGGPDQTCRAAVRPPLPYPSRPLPTKPASVSSVRLKHETKTKHSVTQGHEVETPRNGHAKNRY